MEAGGGNVDIHDDNDDVWNLMPVAPEQSGEGLPYAPENWPNVGDVWGWRSGKRVSTSGYFTDRYLYLPSSLCRARHGHSNQKRKEGFDSKLSLQRYISENFPHVKLEDFFATFSWKIPSLLSGNANPIAAAPIQQSLPVKPSDLPSGFVECKAGNYRCSSLSLEEEEKYSLVNPCDICCVEPGFCRDCCCILCCKTVDLAYGGYNYIKCLVKSDYNICGHVAHMECAIRCLLAGTIGESIGLDAEYYCRRCDGRTDLVSHVRKLLHTCGTIDLEIDIAERILNLCVRLLNGSRKAVAKELLHHIKLSISKLKSGKNHEDIWNVNDNLTAHFAETGLSENTNAATDVTINESSSDITMGIESFGSLSTSVKLELETDQVLKALRKSQEYEYNLANEVLNAHKKYLQNLHQQLESEESELASQHSSSSNLVYTIRERKEQIRREAMKFKDMKKVANGFARTPKDILVEHFGLKFVD